MESNRGRGAWQSMFGFWCLVWCLDVGAGGGDGVAVYRASRCCAWIGGQSRTRKSAAVVKSAQVQGNWKAAQGKHRRYNNKMQALYSEGGNNPELSASRRTTPRLISSRLVTSNVVRLVLIVNHALSRAASANAMAAYGPTGRPDHLGTDLSRAVPSTPQVRPLQDPRDPVIAPGHVVPLSNFSPTSNPTPRRCYCTYSPVKCCQDHVFEAIVGSRRGLSVLRERFAHPYVVASRRCIWFRH
jgi:hypothetical protein